MILLLFEKDSFIWAFKDAYLLKLIEAILFIVLFLYKPPTFSAAAIDLFIFSPKRFSYIFLAFSNINASKKTPKIAIYTPPNKQPWDDAVTLALTYAEVPYKTLWDEDIFNGSLSQYDWLHLHHEDFTGQYGKFYRNYHTASWYIDQQNQFEE